jgi:glutathione synthase/RimK-type ligase-like ATP-grasp enzyme/gamma-glutamyl:cysteine ligase YbdK (ATP-grasp superfamily)
LVKPRVIVVVSDPGDLAEMGVPVVAADEYLAADADIPVATTIVNLCRSYRYRSKGYYVSLVADARGHRVLPAVETLEELSDPYGVYRVLREAGVPTLDVAALKVWKPAETGPDVSSEALVVLGVCTDPRFEEAARAAFHAWPVPVLRLNFVQRGEEWWVAAAEPVPLRRLRPDERDSLARALNEADRTAIGREPQPPRVKRASIAVLFDDDDPFAPSTGETIDHLAAVAASGNVYVHRLGLDELDRLAEFDALFIRSLTGVREPSFQFALRAEMLDMPVVDDPQSIIRCSNKVFLEELLRREGIPTPKTIIVSPRTPWSEVAALGVPLVVKLPDGSFSAAVHRVAGELEYQEVTAEMFRRSPLLIAQEFVLTDFDWRVTVLDGQVLFTARYFMAEGHWQIRTEDGQGERFGRVGAVPRAEAPRDVVALALRAAGLIGKGLYGVDIKETAEGPVVIEINDNPNLDRGDDDLADGDAIYRDLLGYFVRRIEERPEDPVEDPAVKPARPSRRHYRPFSVAGIELEYAVVDENLDPVSLVEPAFRLIAGRPTSEIEVGGVGFSNEIADHVFEVKTISPLRSLARTEELLVGGMRRFSAVLRQEFDARLLPTGMHPWMDPARARLWKRSGRKVYEAYARIFDVGTHGWMNVHAAHLNLPMGRGPEAVAMHNASALLIPYLPALAASSPMYGGRLHESVDNRMLWIFEHQAAIPESQGDLLPEYVASLSDYRRRILQPMYRALDGRPGSEVLKHDFLNARAAVLKFSRRALEIRVLDVQECIKLDIAIAVFVRAVLRHYTQRILRGRMEMPPRQILLGDFRASVHCGMRARVVAPHLVAGLDRDEDGRASARDCLRSLADLAERHVRRDEAEYLELVHGMIETGSLSERIREQLAPYADDPGRMAKAAGTVYGELADCLITNRPWRGRGMSVG